jgi:hypothetical protein
MDMIFDRDGDKSDTLVARVPDRSQINIAQTKDASAQKGEQNVPMQPYVIFPVSRLPRFPVAIHGRDSRGAISDKRNEADRCFRGDEYNVSVLSLFPAL